MGMLKEFWEEEDGIATVEILLILAVLIIIAIIFRNTIINWVKSIVSTIMPDASDTTAQPSLAPGTGG